MKTNEEKPKSKGWTSNDLRPSQWCRLVTTAMESGYAIDGELWRRGEAGRGGARRWVRAVCLPPWEMVNRGSPDDFFFLYHVSSRLALPSVREGDGGTTRGAGLGCAECPAEDSSLVTGSAL